MPKISKTVIPIRQALIEYDRLREETKRIKGRMDVLSKTIKDYAEANGTKNDGGSFYAETDEFIFGKQAKKSVSFDEKKAIDFFEDKGLSDCVELVKRINEEAVEKAVSDGDITFEELESITTTKVTYAIDVKHKEEMADVEQSEILLAASRKPKATPTPKKGSK